MYRAHRGALCFAAVLSVFVAAPLLAKEHTHYGQGFTTDLNEPYDRVLNAVRSISEDNVIRGSSEYRGTNDLFGANPRKSSDAFRTPPRPGTVLYKERPNSIAPDHFYDSNDEGVVTVRYVVQSLGPQSTRLTIDAIFVENNHHRSHPSDGSVENAEYLAISDSIKDIEDKEARQRQDAVVARQQEQIATLQSQVDEENQRVNDLKKREQELLKQVAATEPTHDSKNATVVAANADLKSQPYNESKTLASLGQGQQVAVLQQTRSWVRVQCPDGQQGWIYALMLEVK